MWERACRAWFDKNGDVIWMASYYFFNQKYLKLWAESRKEQMVLYGTRSDADRWCVQLCPGCYSHKQRAPTHVSKFQGNINDWANGRSNLLFLLCTQLKPITVLSGLYSKATWHPQRCLYWVLLTGIFTRQWSVKQAASGSWSLLFSVYILGFC